ncbi:MAG: protein translocase subunit SecF [Myxococcales bacterium]|nr:protein translocase subunit SecF [Myxococcales bacterium]
MEIVKPGTYIDFMRYRGRVISVSLFLLFASAFALIVWPGPQYGIDFAGGTEIQLAFHGNVSSSEIRDTLTKLGHDRPDVVAVEGHPNEYILRIREISSLPENEKDQIEAQIQKSLGADTVEEVKFSPGGDKLSLRLSKEVPISEVSDALHATSAKVRDVTQFGKTSDHRYEARLVGIGDEVVHQLQQAFGARGPGDPLQVQWVGPKAGQQLRNAAIQSLLYTVAFIMVYIAFRFDLRFAPGAVIAMCHDAFITLGIYVLLHKQINLTTVAALLTVMGYSINDTIVVYDRIRENMGRMRGTPLRELINVSTSQMLSRTLLTSGTTLVSVTAFFIWGTPVIQDITFALMIGIVIGTFSSIYIASPITEWFDTRFFSEEARARRSGASSRAQGKA